jgi:hypothetical protein
MIGFGQECKYDLTFENQPLPVFDNMLEGKKLRNKLGRKT